MTLVNIKRPAENGFGKLFDNFFNDFATTSALNFASDMYKNRVPVNVKETEEKFVAELITPGYEKEDFKVDIDNGILTVSAEKKTEAAPGGVKEIRKEFSISSFKKSFTLNDEINADAIEATYKNGILVLNLPKKKEVKAAAKQVVIN